MILVGVTGALSFAGLMTLFQSGSEDAFRGRMFGAIGTRGGHRDAGRHPGGGLPQQAARGSWPVIAVQGAGYLLAGLAMLAFG